MAHVDTSKSQATNRTSCRVRRKYQQIKGTDRPSCHVSRRYQQVTSNKSYFLPCLTHIPAANGRQQSVPFVKSQATVVLLAISHAATSKSQATNRTSCHASRRYQQITANKSYFLPCLTQIPANHKQQIVPLAMSHADASKSQAINDTSCHVSHRYQQITGNKPYFLPFLTQISAKIRQQNVLLAMSRTDTSKSQATKSYFLPCLTQIPANHMQQIVLLAVSHADTCHGSRRYPPITSNRSYFLPRLMQIPANHRQQVVLLAMFHANTANLKHTSSLVSHRYQQITGNKPYFLPYLTQISAKINQQTYFFPCLAQIPAKHKQQNRTSCHVSRRYQQITNIKSYFLPCLTQVPATHKQQIVLLAMSHANTSKSQATNRTSCHVSCR